MQEHYDALDERSAKALEGGGAEFQIAPGIRLERGGHFRHSFDG